MTLTLIISLALIAIVVVCAWQGLKKGIIMGIIEVLVIILSLMGASLLADLFSYELESAAEPFVSGYMDDRIQNCVYEQLGYEPDEDGAYHVGWSVADLLTQNPQEVHAVCVKSFESIGFYASLAEDLAVEAEGQAGNDMSLLEESVIDVAVGTLTWFLCYVIGFVLLLAAMLVVINLPNLSLRLPYLGIVNDLGGLGVGVFVGFLACSVLLWMLRYCGILLPEDELRASAVARYFLDKNLLARYL